MTEGETEHLSHESKCDLRAVQESHPSFATVLGFVLGDEPDPLQDATHLTYLEKMLTENCRLSD